MAAAGCPMDQSAIYKIEKGRPKRRSISVNELVGFSSVFEIPPDELLLPPEVVHSAAARAIAEQLHKDGLEVTHLASQMSEAIHQLFLLGDAQQEVTSMLINGSAALEQAIFAVVDTAWSIAADLLGEDIEIPEYEKPD
jgi:hypothetical protein